MIENFITQYQIPEGLALNYVIDVAWSINVCNLANESIVSCFLLYVIVIAFKLSFLAIRSLNIAFLNSA